jgi:hypothetical protein
MDAVDRHEVLRGPLFRIVSDEIAAIPRDMASRLMNITKTSLQDAYGEIVSILFKTK